MKTNRLQWIIPILVLISAGFKPPNQSDFRVVVQGLDHKNVIPDGLEPAEMTFLTIDAIDSGVEVTEFELLLARGQSPIGVPGIIVSGNQVGLEKFRPFAKAGDRLVINVRKVKPEDELPKERIVRIPIR
jgi:hypothetical protein